MGACRCYCVPRADGVSERGGERGWGRGREEE